MVRGLLAIAGRQRVGILETAVLSLACRLWVWTAGVMGFAAAPKMASDGDGAGLESSVLFVHAGVLASGPR